MNNIIQLGNLYADQQSFGSNPQRGRIYSPAGIAPTLSTCQGGGLEPKMLVRSALCKKRKIIVASRGRRRGEKWTQRLEPQGDLCNTVTTVAKDNLVLEINNENSC